MSLRTGHFPFGHFPSGAFPDGHWPLPPIFPVSLDEAKDHLRVTTDDDDFLIRDLILAATAWAEMFQQRFYISRPTYMYLDRFNTEIIEPTYSPLVSIGSIKYVDTDNVLQLLADTDYRVDTNTHPGRIEAAWTLDWPMTRSITNAVIIEYTAGYGEDSDVPDDIKSALLLLMGHWYENRSIVAGKKIKIPQGAKALLWKRKLVMS